MQNRACTLLPGVLPVASAVRTLVNLIRKENYDQREVLKHTYFPRLVAKACSAPCEQACLRKEPKKASH